MTMRPSRPRTSELGPRSAGTQPGGRRADRGPAGDDRDDVARARSRPVRDRSSLRSMRLTTPSMEGKLVTLSLVVYDGACQ